MPPPTSGRSSLTRLGTRVFGQGAAGDQPGQQPQHLGSGLLGKRLPTTGTAPVNRPAQGQAGVE